MRAPCKPDDGRHAVPGDKIRLGVCIENPRDPHQGRWARLIAIRHLDWDGTSAPRRPFLIRLYANDEESWPTGSFMLTTIFGLMSHQPGEDQ